MLTPKQERFVQEYLIDLNATQAAIRAGYSVKTADKIGSQLLGKTGVAKAVKAAQVMRSGRTEITADRVLREIARIAFFDPRKMFAADGRPLEVSELDDDTAAAIAGLEVLEEAEGSGRDRVVHGYVKKYRVADKNVALEKLAKHLGLYAADNAQKPAPAVSLNVAGLSTEALAEIMAAKDAARLG